MHNNWLRKSLDAALSTNFSKQALEAWKGGGDGRDCDKATERKKGGWMRKMRGGGEKSKLESQEEKGAERGKKENKTE